MPEFATKVSEFQLSWYTYFLDAFSTYISSFLNKENFGWRTGGKQATSGSLVSGDIELDELGINVLSFTW